MPADPARTENLAVPTSELTTRRAAMRHVQSLRRR